MQLSFTKKQNGQLFTKMKNFRLVREHLLLINNLLIDNKSLMIN